MTIIDDHGTWWIEYLVGPTTNVANGAIYLEIVNLERPGDFLGGSGFINNTNVDQNIGGAKMTADPGGFDLVIGQPVTGVTLICINNGLIQDIRMAGLVFIRKSST